MFPVFGLALVHLRSASPTAASCASAIRTAPFALLGWATAVSFWACGCNEGSNVWGTDYVWNQTLIYAGRLLLPRRPRTPDRPSACRTSSAPPRSR